MTNLKRRLRKFPWLYLASGTGLLFVCFAATFYLAFPQAVLKQRLEYELATRSPYPVRLQRAALRPPLTLSVDGVRVQNLPGPVATLEVQKVRLKPRWLALLTGNPGLDFQAAMQQSRLTGSWQRDGQVTMELRDLPLAPWLPESLGVNLSGMITLATLQAQLIDPQAPPAGSRLRIEGTDLALSGLQKYGLTRDQVRFGTAHIVAGSKNSRIDLEKLTITGGDLDISMSGSILLATPLPRSRLNLTLSLRPGPALEPAAVELLAAVAKPAADGSLQISITGPAGQPQLH